MKEFTELLSDLILTTSINRKVELLCSYFGKTNCPERGIAVAAIVGDLESKFIKSSFLKDLISTQIDPTLFAYSYDYVGDLAETIALLWPQKSEDKTPSLSKVFKDLKNSSKEELKIIIPNLLDNFSSDQRWAFIKLFTGGLRVGVSARLVKKALAIYGNTELEEIEKLWHGLQIPYTDLFLWLEGRGEKPQVASNSIFHPMMLSNPINEDRELPNIDANDFIVENKWDGIRLQISSSEGHCKLFSRTGDEITQSFPELVQAIHGNFVFDGELLAGKNNVPSSFNKLQKRLNKKKPTQNFILENPVFIKVYDVLFFEGIDQRDKTLQERKALLNGFFNETRIPLFLSETIQFNDSDHLRRIKDKISEEYAEGLMLKNLHSCYVSGRPRGLWYKWKREAKTLDAIIMYAQRGHGKRSSYYSDFTFGVLNEVGNLVPIGKAYTGFTDLELLKLDKFVRSNTIGRFGPVREVNKTLVVEVAFDKIMQSNRHKSGIAMRFPRFKRIRWDKPVNEVEPLEKIMDEFL